MMAYVDRTTPLYKCLASLGFVFHEPRFPQEDIGITTGRFLCMCGTGEDYSVPDDVEIVSHLESTGSFSEEHLISDGYAADLAKAVASQIKKSLAIRSDLPNTDFVSRPKCV